MNQIEKGIYRHYKGNLYEVVDIARNSENLDYMVVYRALKDEGQLWVRPLSMFLENVETEGKICRRFEYIDRQPSESIIDIRKIPNDCKMVEATDAQAEVLNKRLGEYNIKYLNYKGENTLYRNYIIKDAANNIIAGIRGGFYLKTCAYVSILFVDENHRKQGLGSILLSAMEQEARLRGAELIHLDTFSFQAKDFYLKHGYEIYGVLDECPKGHKRYYFRKLL